MVDAQLVIVAPLFILAAAGIILPLSAGRTRADRAVLVAISLVALLVAALLSFAALYDVPGLGFMRDAWTQTGGVAYGVYELDAFALAFQLVFITVAGLVVLGSPTYITGRNQGEYYALLALSTLGMMVVAGSRDLVTLFIGFELSSFATYVLAGYFKNAEDSNEAAFKYFIIGSLSASLTLFGTSIVYGLVGSTSFVDLGAFTEGVFADLQRAPDATFPPLLIFAWGFLLAGFGFKIALVPFHNWAPDVYDGSPSTVSAFLAAGSKKMGFAALFKLFIVGLIAVKANWIGVAAVIAVVTMTVGNVVALRQDNVKRMLAYSSIAQAGYMLIALPIATQYAIAGGLFQIITHSVMKTGAFLVVAAFATFGVGELIDQWKGMGRRAPLLGFSMAVFLLSLAGMPPFAGFTSKFVLFSAAIAAGEWFVWLAIAGIVNSAISLFYYARVIRVMYVEGDESGAPPARLSTGPAITVAVVLAMLVTVGIGLFPEPFIDLSLAAAASLAP